MSQNNPTAFTVAAIISLMVVLSLARAIPGADSGCAFLCISEPKPIAQERAYYGRQKELIESASPGAVCDEFWYGGPGVSWHSAMVCIESGMILSVGDGLIRDSLTHANYQKFVDSLVVVERGLR